MGQGAVSIDYCDAHGTWFDRGEIERVIWAVRSPAGNAQESSTEESSSSGDGVVVGLEILGVCVELLAGLAD